MRAAKASLLVAITGGFLTIVGYAGATENAQERRDARDTKQDSRQDARKTKQDCKKKDGNSNADCRQDKRSDKQEGRQESREVRAGKPPATTK